MANEYPTSGGKYERSAPDADRKPAAKKVPLKKTPIKKQTEEN